MSLCFSSIKIWKWPVTFSGHSDVNASMINTSVSGRRCRLPGGPFVALKECESHKDSFLDNYTHFVYIRAAKAPLQKLQQFLFSWRFSSRSSETVQCHDECILQQSSTRSLAKQAFTQHKHDLCGLKTEKYDNVVPVDLQTHPWIHLKPQSCQEELLFKKYPFP